MTHEPDLHNKENPLVSILIYNYNYGRYLEECLESLCTQTYPNIEIVFSDNASTDSSWEIALGFVKKYPGRMTITQNRKNLGVDANFRNCFLNARGKYFINMCSDDVLMPDFTETCVRVMEDNLDVGFVMTHRGVIDAEGKQTDEPPFYNKSCIVPGPEQAAVYMMAAVNPSVSQIMYNIKSVTGKSATGELASRWYGARILDFNMCTEYSMAYITEPLMLHRIHGENDSLSAAANLLEVIGPYVLQHQFADSAEAFKMDKVIERLPASLEKLAHLSLRYCIRSLTNKDFKLAKRYFYLSFAISSEIEEHETSLKLQRYWSAGEDEKESILGSFHQTNDLVTRMVSYEPPEGSTPL